MSKLSLSVVPGSKAARVAAVTLTGPADLRDQRWLDERIDTARNGIEAVIDIALNWTAGRNVSRLHPGVAAADYVRENVGLIGREAVVPLLTESNWSNRQIAAVAGVPASNVDYAERQLRESHAVERPAETLGADGKLRSVAPAPDRWQPASGLMSSDNVEWYTPKHVLDAVVATMGGIDLDPCAEPAKSVPASKHYTEAEDGLGREWVGRVYMNPPYGRVIGAWVDHLADEYDAKRVTEAVALVPARTDTAWFAHLPWSVIAFITGRLSFSDHDNPAPFPSAACYLGPNDKAFAAAFLGLGLVAVRLEVGG